MNLPDFLSGGVFASRLELTADSRERQGDKRESPEEGSVHRSVIIAWPGDFGQSESRNVVAPSLQAASRPDRVRSPWNPKSTSENLPCVPVCWSKRACWSKRGRSSCLYFINVCVLLPSRLERPGKLSQ